ncbi:MAG: hypothetical protein JWQ78_1579, partial [Sediminibacterium sp.]|nr:hypothetical protein [Sediminibacterium sp.]
HSRPFTGMKTYCLIGLLLFASCRGGIDQTKEVQVVDSFSASEYALKDTVIAAPKPEKADSFAADNTRNRTIDTLPQLSVINTGSTSPDELMRFAETLQGIPYVYGSTDPRVGFDCSGFITHVFNHFKIQVPRSSIDFTRVGKTVPVEQAKRGDIILFTGTNKFERYIGHMGLVVSANPQELNFIHATSGKAMAVAITKLNDQYKQRFIRISRIFGQNN